MSATGKHHLGSGLFDDDSSDFSNLNTGVVTVTTDASQFPDPGIDPPSASIPAGSLAIATAASPAGTSRPATDAGAPIAVPAPTLTVASYQAFPVSSGNLSINLEFDAAAMAAPASFRTEMEQAATLLSEAITPNDPITINLQIEYNEDGIAAGSAYAGPWTGLYEPYSIVRADLIANAPGDTNFDTLPAGTTFQGQSEVAVWNGELKALGLLQGDASGLDGYANFSADIPTDALVGVALHELTHAMGRVPYASDGSPDIFDLFRFTTPGTVLIEDQIPATAAYFSVNSGATALAEYGLDSDPSDFLNASSLTPNDAFNEFYTPGQTFQTLTPVDLTQLDVLGFNTTGLPTRTFYWTGASDGNFGNALNWNDSTDVIDPAATPPGTTDLASITNGGSITGTGTVYQLAFAGTNTVSGALTALASVTGNSGTLIVTGALTMSGATLFGTLSAKSGGRVDASQSIFLSSGVLSVDGGSSVEVGTAGGAADGLITVDESGQIHGVGTVAAAVLNNGTISPDAGNPGGNVLEINGAVTGSGTIALQPGASTGSSAIMQLDSSVAASQQVDFESAQGAPPELRLLDAAQFAGTLDNFDYAGDTMDLVGKTITGASIDGLTMTVTLSAGGPLTFNLAGNAATTSELFVNGSNISILPLRMLDWTGSSNTDFGNAANWNDTTDGLDPATAAPGVTDNASIELPGTLTGSGDVYEMLFDGTANAVAGVLASTTSADADYETLTVTGTLTAEITDLYSSSLQVSSGGKVQASVYAFLYPYTTVSEISVDGSSSVELGTAGGAAAGHITIDTGAGIYGDGTLAAAVVNNGFIYAYSNTVGDNVIEITGALTGDGVVDLANGSLNNGTVIPGAMVQLDSSVASSQTFDYFGSSVLGTAPDLRLLEPSIFNGTLEFFDSVGDSLELVGQTVTDASITGSTLTVTVLGGGPFKFNLLDTPISTQLEWSGDEVAVAGVARALVWAGSSDSTVFGDQFNWDDVTDALDPAALAPGASDTAEFVGGGSPVTGAGTVAALSFSGNGVWNLTSGALLTASGSVVVGSSQPGVVVIDDGSGLVSTGAAGLTIADTAGASGSSVNVSGAGSDLAVTGTLIVGSSGYGSLSLSQGATVTASSLDVAAGATGDGAISIVGTGTTLDITGSLTLGDQATGELSILGGAQLTIAGGVIGGSGVNATGNVDIEGSGSQLTINAGTLLVGAQGPAEFTLGINGTLDGEVATEPNGVTNIYGNVDPATLLNDGAENIGNSQGGTSQSDDFYIANSGTITIKGTATFYTPLVTFETAAADTSTTGLWVIGAKDTLVMNAASADVSQTFDFTSANGAELVIGQVPSGPNVNNLDTLVQNGTTLTTPLLTNSPVLGASALLNGGWAAPIENYTSGDVIVLRGLTYGSANAVGDVVTVWSEANGTGNNLGSLTFVDKSGNPSSAEATAAAVQINALACFAAGTRIETADGLVAVEALRVGDTITTVLGGSGYIVWVGSRMVDCARHPRPEAVWPVRIARGAIGANTPARDLYVSPDHALYVNGMLIPAKYLMNGTSVRQVRRRHVTYYHIELEQHDVILAEGLPAESYLDTGDRANFANGRGPVALFPNFTALRWEAEGCARLVVTGPHLETVRAMVAARSAEIARTANKRAAPGQSRQDGRLIGAHRKLGF